MNDTRAYYDKTAAEWAENGYHDEAYLPCLDGFLSLLPPRRAGAGPVLRRGV